MAGPRSRPHTSPTRTSTPAPGAWPAPGRPDSLEARRTWENCAKVRSASMGTCPSSSWQQSLRVGGRGGLRGRAPHPPPSGWRPGRALTAQGSAWARTRAGYTGCTGTRGRPGWPGSPGRTAGQPQAAAGSPCALQGATLVTAKPGRAGTALGWGAWLTVPGPTPLRAPPVWAHPSGSGRHPPAGECCPPGSR